MKNLRLEKIKQIITTHEVNTQNELLTILQKEGFNVTQATVSRDINRLMLMKIPTGTGRYRYACRTDSSHSYSIKGHLRIFQDSVLSMDFSENIIVMHTLPGSAEAVAFFIDYIKFPEILGTLAGDNTLLIIIKSNIITTTVLKKLQTLLKMSIHKTCL
ncbi:arginine repressor [Pectinatus sottacetonis]|uniref:arginine repressor n=1 Tax=Pectinatus sottacetonis TaxID=1002795 RepID=UPI0018C7948A|nr:arginine repressor [Pectinatus sottacetonis]